jgi:hypothetical protein
MPARIPLPRDPAEQAVIQELQLRRAEARQRGWTAQLVDRPMEDESDVRLLVRRRGAPVRVEVLGPGPDLPAGHCWQAVRVRGGSRVVWCGPERRCGSELLDFVADLLDADDEVLARRYQSLS